jgi:hypothetical protein
MEQNAFGIDPGLRLQHLRIAGVLIGVDRSAKAGRKRSPHRDPVVTPPQLVLVVLTTLMAQIARADIGSTDQPRPAYQKTAHPSDQDFLA